MLKNFVAAMALGPTDIAVSLGTSDTVFLSLDSLPEEGLGEGHIFANPVRKAIQRKKNRVAGS